MQSSSPYSSWLVASDIDSTLINKKRLLPPENPAEIKKFTDKGGNFTLASDRNPELMRDYYKNLPLGGIPAVVMGGAGIYDFKEEKMLSFTALSEDSVRKTKKIAEKFPTLDVLIDTKDTLYISGIGYWAHFFIKKSKATYKYFRNIADVPPENWGKVVFIGAMWRVKQIGKVLRSVSGREFSVIDSSSVSVQIQAKGANKGAAVMEIARMLGVEKDHTAAIGDYYNDYKMLSEVEIAGCTASAPREVKAISDYVACHCNDGAVADFLRYLTAEIDKENINNNQI